MIMMRVLTWNINGIRACKQPLKNELSDLDSDIICLQETKITRDLLDEETAIQDGYNSFFSFSKKRSGYSGVATYCRTHTTPVRVEEGLSGVLHDDSKAADVIGHYGDLSEFTNEELVSLDSEGRALLTEHQYRDSAGEASQLVLINVYCPRADPDKEGRLEYKLGFYKLLQIRAEALLQANKQVIILGDFNVSHKPIDHCDPDGDEEKYYARPSRQWITRLLEEIPSDQAKKPSSQSKSRKKFIDTFRYFYPKRENAFTCWSTKSGARQTNYGTRIDYIVSNTGLCRGEIEDCEILQDFEGSDHCPVRATLKGSMVTYDQIPSSCTKFMPEFLGGKQRKLLSFFTKGEVKGKEVADNNSSKIISEQRTNGACATTVSSGKRRLEAPAKPSSKKARSLNPSSRSKKTSSITTFFKKVPTAPQPLGEEAQKSGITGSLSQPSATVGVASSVGRLSQPSGESSSLERLSQGEKDMKSDDLDNCPALLAVSGNKEPEDTRRKKKMASSWKDILKGPPPAPLCKGHQEPCVLRTVKKPGPNLGKQFYVCCRPEGHKNNPEARCNNFVWVGPAAKRVKDGTSKDKSET